MKENDIEEGFWVFVSHSTKDFERVRLVRNALEDSGFRPILFYLKCLENENEVNDLLKREIDARKRFILCDSPNAQASKFVQSEVDYIRSKNRMYEVVDLSQIDMDGQDAEKEVLELIKPFRRRTKVFLSFSNDDRVLAYNVKSELTKEGFTVVDSDSVYYEAEDGMYGAAGSAYYYQDLDRLVKIFVDAYIENTLKEGYVVSLLGMTSYKSNYQFHEIEQALSINPSRIMPIIVDEMDLSQLPDPLKRVNIQNISSIILLEDKAKAIVEELIKFDFRNNK